MPLHHSTLIVPAGKLEEMVTFLTRAMHHMSFKEFYRPAPHAVGLGETVPYFWLLGLEMADEEEKVYSNIVPKQHIAFEAQNNQQVDEYHAAALKAGATCNGPPGLRPQYHPGYYGAFVRDPVCGINIEMVCFNKT